MATRFEAFDAFAKYLAGHPAARAGKITWRRFEGVPTDDDPPTEAACPWVRLTPYGGESRWVGKYTYESPLYVQVETVTKGTAAEPSFALWAILLEAIYSGPAVTLAQRETAFRAAGISDVTVISAAEGPDPAMARQYGPTMTYNGRGLIRLDLHVQLNP